MNSSKATSGSCLCGEVTWRSSGPVRSVLECHCHRCQKVTGNYMAASAAANDSLTIEGDGLRWYSPPDDPNVAYGFCPRCGSSLFYRSGVADDSNTTTSICVGSFDDASELQTIEVWYGANAANHVRLDPAITTFPAEPPTV